MAEQQTAASAPTARRRPPAPSPKTPLATRNGRPELKDLLATDPSKRSSSVNWDVLERLAAEGDAGTSPDSPETSPAPPERLPSPPLVKSKGKRVSSQPDDSPPPSPPRSPPSPNPRPTVQPGPSTPAPRPATRQFGTPLDINAPFTFSAPHPSSSRTSSLPSSTNPRPTKKNKTRTAPSVSTQPSSSRETPTLIPASGVSRPTGARRSVPPIPSAANPAKSLYDRFLSLQRLPGRRKAFRSNVDKPFRDAAARAAEAYIRNPCERNLLLFLELPKRWLTPALQGEDMTARQRLDKFLAERDDMEWPTPPSKKSTTPDKASEAHKLVQIGRLGTACRVMTEDTAVADPNDAVVDQIMGKHPPGPITPYGDCDGPVNCRPPTKTEVLAALNDLDPDGAPGISGWTGRMLKIAADHPKVAEFLTLLVAGICAGTAPGRDMLCSAKLTALKKKDGGTRPIAVGEVLYRLAMRAILAKVLKGKSPLLASQLGVKSKGGVEPIVTAVNMAINGELDQDYTDLVSLDATNAFNAMCRRVIAEAVNQYLPGLFRCARWAYQFASDLALGELILQSCQGCRQGDPLGPLLFSLGLRPVLEALQKHLGPHRKVIAYLDDMFVLSTDDKALDEILAFFENHKHVVRLNPRKCKTVKLDDAAENGFELLGTVIGARQARVEFLRSAIARQKEKISRLKPLDSQAALLLLRKCISADLRHLQRTLRTTDMLEEWDDLDVLLWEEVKRLRNRPDIDGPDGIEDDCLGRAASTLPAKYGGLDLLSHKDIAPHASAAALESATLMVDKIFGTNITGDRDPSAFKSQSVRCKAMWEQQRTALMRRVDPLRGAALVENASEIGRKWLNTIPYFQPLRLSDAVISAGLRVRTLARAHRPVCRCGQPTTFLHEDVCDKNWTVIRHNDVRDTIARSLRCIPSCEITVEPRTLEGSRRNDIGIRRSRQRPPEDSVICVRGPGRTGRRNTDYDLKVYCCTSTMAFTRNSSERQPPAEVDPLDFYSDHCEKFLQRIYKKAYNHKPEARADFVPLVMSAGGYMLKDTVKVFESWTELTKYDMARLKQGISISLVTSRARKIAECEVPRDYVD